VNRGEMRAVCQANIRDVAGTGREQAEWDELLQAAYADVTAEIPIVEDEQPVTLVGGENEVAMSAPVVMRVPPAFFRDGFPIPRVPRRRLAPPARGAPTAWALLGRRAIFDGRPTGDLSLTLVAARTPAALAADADEPAFAEAYHRVVPYTALARAFIADRQFDGGAYWNGEAEKIKRSMRLEYSRRHRARRSREDSSDGD